MINEKIGYSYNDLRIVPEVISDIRSRIECNPFDKDGNLPIFTSPMSTIVNIENCYIWEQNKIIPIMPRNIGVTSDENTRIQYLKEAFLYNPDRWYALSLNEFDKIFVHLEVENAPCAGNTYYICVDIANGHMKALYETINKAKNLADEIGYKLIVMTGNIANPETYKWICENANVDYIRLSIGTGNNCVTASNTGIHYPIASLIDECYKYASDIIKFDNEYYNTKTDKTVMSKPKIIADGGIRNYDDVIKAYALGADYVMIGSLFTAALESAGEMTIESYNSHYRYIANNGVINDGVNNIIYTWKLYGNLTTEETKRSFIKEMKSIIKESYGMSTKKAQKLIAPNIKPKTSEGCTKYIPVKYTINQWVENMVSYLRSAMSYCNKTNLSDFKGNVTLKVQSNCSILAVNK